MRRYGDRDHIALDKEGDFYIRHVSAMTYEDLHSKSEIAGELAYRDMLLSRCYTALRSRAPGHELLHELEKFQ